jgi:Cell division control protein 24, OB domain 3
MYKKRVYIKSLRSHMINITLFGRIVAMANNVSNPNVLLDPVTCLIQAVTYFIWRKNQNPYRGGKGDQPMDRYAIRLVDETAQIDVTLWEAVGHRARRLREGHYVLITGLSTSKLYKGSNGQTTWYVNGSTSCGTEIVNGKMDIMIL